MLNSKINIEITLCFLFKNMLTFSFVKISISESKPNRGSVTQGENPMPK